MSSKRGFSASTKVQEDENTDSGFLSGPISGLLSSEDLSVESESKEDSSSDVRETEIARESVPELQDPVQLDSGLDLSEFISGDLDDLETPTATAAPTKASEYPPLAILFQQDDDGDTQLHIAAVHGCNKSVGTLIRVCPDKAWLDVPNDFGQSALHLAAHSGHSVVTRMLVLAGATVGLRDLAGETPLHIAASAGHTECLQALLSPIPERTTRRLAATLNEINYEGQTCTHLAAAAGHLEALQTLVFYGADVNARENLCGRTALHVAAARGDVTMARLLLARGAAASARDYAGRTPRRLAARTAAASVFDSYRDSSDDESDSDDELSYDSDQSLFERLREGMNAINVA